MFFNYKYSHIIRNPKYMRELIQNLGYYLQSIASVLHPHPSTFFLLLKILSHLSIVNVVLVDTVTWCWHIEDA